MLDSDGSGDLSSSEFQAAMKKLVRNLLSISMAVLLRWLPTPLSPPSLRPLWQQLSSSAAVAPLRAAYYISTSKEITRHIAFRGAPIIYRDNLQ